MGQGLDGGNAFMEDYTYHLNPSNPSILGSHMLEVDPVLAVDKPSCEIHPLGIGGKADPVRLVFNSRGNIDSLNNYNHLKTINHQPTTKIIMAAISVFRSRFFVPLCYTKRAPLKPGCVQFDV